jgi:hypothetical protein
MFQRQQSARLGVVAVNLKKKRKKKGTAGFFPRMCSRHSLPYQMAQNCEQTI